MKDVNPVGWGIKFMEVLQSKQLLGSKLEKNCLRLNIDCFLTGHKKEKQENACSVNKYRGIQI